MGDGRTSEVVAFWGLPLARLDMAGAVDRVAALIEAGQPTQVITANLNFAMHCETSPRLRRIAAEAGMVTADGMPMVILSRLKGDTVTRAGHRIRSHLPTRRTWSERGLAILLLWGCSWNR